MTRRRHRLLSLGLAAASVVVGVAGLEVFLRATDIREFVTPSGIEQAVAEKTRSLDGRANSLYRADATFGWTLRANVRVAAWEPYFENDAIATNSLGHYDDEPDPGKRIVLIAGDSFVEGVQVGRAGHFTALLEQVFDGVDVLNLGTSGYGSVQAYLRVADAVATIGASHVVFAVYFGNDFDENVYISNGSMAGSLPDYRRDHVPFWRDGAVVYGRDALDPLDAWLRDQSLAYNVAVSGLARLASADDPGVRIAHQVIDRLASDLAARDVGLSVLLIPDDGLVTGEVPRTDYDAFRAGLEGRGLHVVSLLDPFAATGRTTMGYLADDGSVRDRHWNLETHLIVFETLARALAPRL